MPSKIRAETPEIVMTHSFIVKPVGTGTRQTLVDSDSLSSFSLPEETSNRTAVVDNSNDRDKEGVNGNQSVLGEHSMQNRRSELAIDIDQSDEDQPTEPTQIKTYLKFMYNICASPYDPDRVDGPGGMGSCSKILDFVRKGCFAIFATASILEALFLVKLQFLFNLNEGGLENFTDLAFFIMNACTKIYYVYLVVKQQNKMTRMNDSFCKLRRFTRQHSKGYQKPPRKFSTKLGIITVMVSLIQTLFVGWTPTSTILRYSLDKSFDLFLWKPDSISDEDTTTPIFEKYGKDLTTTNVVLGICGAIMNYCSNMHLDVAGDLILVTAEGLKEEIGRLEAMMKDPKHIISNITLEEFQSETGLWGHYRVLKQAVHDTNDAFDSLLKYMHVENLMRFVYFVMNVFDWEFPLFNTLRLVFTIFKTSYMYRSATDASKFNDSGRDWVRQLAMKSKDKMFLDKAVFIMDELKKQPLGLGTGQFLINESFLFRFLGSVGSVFVLQAQSREGSNAATG